MQNLKMRSLKRNVEIHKSVFMLYNIQDSWTVRYLEGSIFSWSNLGWVLCTKLKEK